MSRIFSCCVCSDEILPEKPRIHCQVCLSYDLCANCFVCEKSSQNHDSTHATTLFEMSGYVPRPPPMPPRPALPQRPAATPTPAGQRRPVSMQVPPTASGQSVAPPKSNYQPPSINTPDVSSPQTFYPPPPSPRPPVSPHSVGPTPSRQTLFPPPPPPQSSFPPPPSQPPRPSSTYAAPPAPSPQAALPQFPPTGSWGPLFNGQVPTALGMAFFNTLFTCLDSSRSGLLRPEQYSAFLDVLGYTLAEDVWKNQMSQSVFGYSREDLADYELKQAYVNFSIDHQLGPRAQSPNQNQDSKNWASSLNGFVGKAMTNAGSLPPLSGGMMPMLTRQGFIDICTVEFLYDPAKGWTYAKAASRHYGVWPELGEVPRSALPDVAPPELVHRTKLAQLQAQERAQEALDAQRVKMMIQKQGRDAALDLVSDYRYRY